MSLSPLANQDGHFVACPLNDDFGDEKHLEKCDDAGLCNCMDGCTCEDLEEDIRETRRETIPW
jgi:hypothetical protein